MTAKPIAPCETLCCNLYGGRRNFEDARAHESRKGKASSPLLLFPSRALSRTNIINQRLPAAKNLRFFLERFFVIFDWLMRKPPDSLSHALLNNGKKALKGRQVDVG